MTKLKSVGIALSIGALLVLAVGVATATGGAIGADAPDTHMAETQPDNPAHDHHGGFGSLMANAGDRLGHGVATHVGHTDQQSANGGEPRAGTAGHQTDHTGDHHADRQPDATHSGHHADRQPGVTHSGHHADRHCA